MTDTCTDLLRNHYLRREPLEGGGFRYLCPDGREYRERDGLERIAALAVPPAYHEVFVSPDPDEVLQAFGRDARGRLQYRYHPDFVHQRAMHKWQRLARFAAVLPRLRERTAADLRGTGLRPRKVLALMVCLLDSVHPRVGNTDYARQNKTHGLCTLRKKHVRVEGDLLVFHYRGKHGVEQQQAVRDRRLARLVSRLRELPGGALFRCEDGMGGYRTLRAAELNAYIRDLAGPFSAKDFRTWGGTSRAAAFLAAAGPPSDERSGARMLGHCVRAVAEQLGNTAAVTRESYICPVIFDLYLAGELAAAADAAGSAALPDEVLSRLLARGLRRRAADAPDTAVAPRLAAGGLRP